MVLRQYNLGMVEEEIRKFRYRRDPREVLELTNKIQKLRSQGKLRREIAVELGVAMGVIDWYLDPERTKRYRVQREKLEVKARRKEHRNRPEVKRRYRESRRRWRRENRLRIQVNGVGVQIKVKKRIYPEGCEVCGGRNVRLDWHHWDDDHPEKGIWACKRCHILADGLEGASKFPELVTKYIDLKAKYLG